MSASQKVHQLKLQFDNFSAINFAAFFQTPGSYQEWDGFNIQELSRAVEFIRNTMGAGFEKNIFQNMPVASLTALINQLASASQHCQSLVANPGNQGVFQNASAQVDSLMHNLMIYDVPFMVAGGIELDSARKIYERESSRLSELSVNAEALNKSIKNLIEPAVSGSLSKSFSERRKSLFTGRLVWGFLTVTTLIGGIVATGYLINELVSALSHVPAQKPGEPQHEVSVVLLLAIRSAILLPIYVALGFFFSQYRKERDLEEEYAHKAAVATSLPNYGDLAKDVAVKDQIVSGASNVIFTSPIRKVQDQDSETLPIETIKGLLEAVSKVLPKRN